MFFQELASLNVPFSVKHICLNRNYMFVNRKRDMYRFIQSVFKLYKNTNLKIALKIMYKRRNCQQNWYGK